MLFDRINSVSKIIVSGKPYPTFNKTLPSTVVGLYGNINDSSPQKNPRLKGLTNFCIFMMDTCTAKTNKMFLGNQALKRLTYETYKWSHCTKLFLGFFFRTLSSQIIVELQYSRIQRTMKATFLSARIAFDIISGEIETASAIMSSNLSVNQLFCKSITRGAINRNWNVLQLSSLLCNEKKFPLL